MTNLQALPQSPMTPPGSSERSANPISLHKYFGKLSGSIRHLTHEVMKQLLQTLENFVQVWINLRKPSIASWSMNTLTSKDTENLLLAVQQLYALHDLSSFGRKYTFILDQLVPSEIPIFSLNQPPNTGNFSYLPSWLSWFYA